MTAYHVDIEAVRAEIAVLQKNLAKVPKELQKGVRSTLREAAQEVVDTARVNAGWSDRIPYAFKIQTRFGQSRRPGVVIQVVNKGETSHARPFEGLTQAYFRHPVFADTRNKTRREWTWVTQATRPYVVPALNEEQDHIITMLSAQIALVLRQYGMNL